MTEYTINSETSTSVSADDCFHMFKTSTGRTMRAHASAIATYVLGNTVSATVGFFGATKVIQQSGAGQADILSTAAITSTATNWGYATSTQANGIVTLLRQIRTDLVTYGLLKGS